MNLIRSQKGNVEVALGLGVLALLMISSFAAYKFYQGRQVVPAEDVVSQEETFETEEDFSSDEEESSIPSGEVQGLTTDNNSTTPPATTQDGSNTIRIQNQPDGTTTTITEETTTITTTTQPDDGGSGEINIANFKYPGATTSSESSTQLIMTSNASADSITDWYEGRIRSLGLSAKNFVKVSTNGDVNNELAGAGNGEEIRVEITKESGASNVHIRVTRS